MKVTQLSAKGKARRDLVVRVWELLDEISGLKRDIEGAGGVLATGEVNDLSVSLEVAWAEIAASRPLFVRIDCPPSGA